MRALLTLNTGSSSVKFRLFGLSAGLPLLAGGKVTDIGTTPHYSARVEGGDAATSHALDAKTSHEEAVEVVLAWLHAQKTGWQISAVAHRIVHGGERFSGPARLDTDAITYLRSLSPLAPLHQPHNIAGIDIFTRKQPELPQYGCFDTAFHARHDALFSSFALPAPVREKGVKRYGFHGLSYDWVSHCLDTDYPHLHNARVVAAHLGNGASLCAMQGGKSIDTTMGMTAIDGLPMGTRCGSLDPGVVFYMQRDLGISLKETEYLLYEESGLKGLSGISNDVKTLTESKDPRAAFALTFFAHKTAQHIASMAVSLGGMDALIFTGGIGENAPGVREDILSRLSFLPAFETHIIAANEERSMALEIHERFKEELCA